MSEEKYQVARYGTRYEVQDTTLGESKKIALCYFKKDADFIAQACNGNKALLDACKGGFRLLGNVKASLIGKECSWEEYEMVACLDEVMDVLKPALTLAEPKEGE